MLIKLYVDKNGLPIDTGKIYKDVKNNVSDICILERDGNYYAKPKGLDEELLKAVYKGLVEQC